MTKIVMMMITQMKNKILIKNRILIKKKIPIKKMIQKIKMMKNKLKKGA